MLAQAVGILAVYGQLLLVAYMAGFSSPQAALVATGTKGGHMLLGLVGSRRYEVTAAIAARF